MRNRSTAISQHKAMAMGKKPRASVRKMADGGMTGSSGGRATVEPGAMRALPNGALNRPGLATDLAATQPRPKTMPVPEANEPMIDVTVRKVRQVTGLKNGGVAKRGKKC